MRRTHRPAGPAAGSRETVLGRILPGTELVAASTSRGIELLQVVDDFVSNQSQFDRQARVHLRRDVLEVTREVYLDYVGSQVMDWPDNELELLRQIVESIAARFARLDLTLPDRIFLVKTNGSEEGYAAYTRQMNVIVLPENMVSSLETSTGFGDPLHPTSGTTYLQDVLIHELFHIFSKNNPGRRYELYRLLHFYPTGNAVDLPGVKWPENATTMMPDMKITNPDTPALDVYIEMNVPSGGGSDHAKTPLLPVLLSNAAYSGGIFFTYLQWWFMAIERTGGRWVARSDGKGRPLLYSSQSLLTQYLDLVGRNFGNELFHPDEILAQSFVLVANQPSLGVLSAVNQMLAKHQPSA